MKKNRKTFCGIDKKLYFCARKESVIAPLCNGSTADSGSACLGSSPSGATRDFNRNRLESFFVSGVFWFKVYPYEKECIAEAIELAKASDIAIIVCGDNTFTSSEGHDRADLKLPGKQRELIEAVAKTGKPVVLVLENGRAVKVRTDFK